MAFHSRGKKTWRNKSFPQMFYFIIIIWFLFCFYEFILICRPYNCSSLVWFGVSFMLLHSWSNEWNCVVTIKNISEKISANTTEKNDLHLQTDAMQCHENVDPFNRNKLLFNYTKNAIWFLHRKKLVQCYLYTSIIHLTSTTKIMIIHMHS